KDDWSKTNYNYPKQPPADDWGNTVPNVRQDDIDFNKTYMPGANNQPNDWGNTQGNIKLPQDVNYGGGQEDFGSRGGNDYGATTPYFRLPDAERAKYQNVPPTPTQEAEKKRQEEKAKGGVPGWLWVSGGLLAMFLFTILVLLIVYIFILRDTGFEQTVKGAPQGSSVLVNGAYWGTTSDDGTIILPTLRAGETKKVEIKHPNWVCEPQDIKGEDGVKREAIIARCKQVANISNECLNIKAGEVEKAERCANKALDELGSNFSIDDLLRALNLFVINFESNKSDIPPARMAFLQKAAGYLQKAPPGVVIEIGGHTDSDGSDAANQALSESRAKAVREALIKFNVKPEMLTEKGYGEAKPIKTNETDDGKFQNRRIEYQAVKK
ncbi:MAG TPA: OmpA family protein, partial [Pyrinomonadaceae bacterium]|nr:OmpA family protein [Pyrinomonadaceae bacterium]